MMLFNLLVLTATVEAVSGDFSVGDYTPNKQCSEVLTCNKSTIQWSTANNRFEYFQKCTAKESDFTARIDRLTVASYAVATIVGENLDECVSGGLDAVKKSYRKSYSEFYSPRKSKFESGPRFKFAKFDGDVFYYKGSLEMDGGYMPGELCSEFVPRIENGKPNRSRGYEPTTTVFHLHCGNRTSFKNGCDATAKVVPIKMSSAKNSTLSKKLAVYKEPEHQIDEIMYQVRHGCQIKEAIPFSSLYVEWDSSEMKGPLVFSDRVLHQLKADQQHIQDILVQEDIDALKAGSISTNQVRVPFSKVSQRLQYAVERKQKIEQCSTRVQNAFEQIAELAPLDPRRQTLQANTLEKDEQAAEYLTQLDALLLKRKERIAAELVVHQGAVNQDIVDALEKVDFLKLRLEYYQSKQRKLDARTEKLKSAFPSKEEPLSPKKVQPSDSMHQGESQPTVPQSHSQNRDYNDKITNLQTHIKEVQQYIKRRKTVLLKLTQTHEKWVLILDKMFDEHQGKVKSITDKWSSLMDQSERIQVHSVTTTSTYENRTSELQRCEQDNLSLTRYHNNYTTLSEQLGRLERDFTKVAEVQSALVSLDALEEQIKGEYSFEKKFEQLSESNGPTFLLKEGIDTSSWSKKLQWDWTLYLSRRRIQMATEQWFQKTPKDSEELE